MALAGAPRVAGEARPLQSIGIEAANALVGPGGGVRPGVGEERDSAAVALLAAAVCGRRPLDDLAEDVVERTEDLAGGGVTAGLELARLPVVALAAILGRHEEGDGEPMVLEGVLVGLVRRVALVAADGAFRMPARGALLHDAGRGGFLVALDARLALGREGGERIGGGLRGLGLPGAESGAAKSAAARVTTSEILSVFTAFPLSTHRCRECGRV